MIHTCWPISIFEENSKIFVGFIAIISKTLRRGSQIWFDEIHGYNSVLHFSSFRTTLLVIQDQRRIQNPVKYLGWNFLRKWLTLFSRKLFSQKAPCWMFDWVLNGPLNSFFTKALFQTAFVKNKFRWLPPWVFACSAITNVRFLYDLTMWPLLIRYIVF